MNDIDPSTGRRTATDPRRHARYTIGFFTDDNKFGDVTDPLQRAAALTVHAASIGITIERGNDGHVRAEEVLERTGLAEHPEIAKILIAHDVWHQADHGCLRCPQPRDEHVYVHDTLEHNRSAAQHADTTTVRAQAGAKGGATRWAGHTPKPRTTGGRPGRPRKNPVAMPAETPADSPRPDGQLTLPVPGNTEMGDDVHPAEARARAESERAARSRNSRDKAEAKVYEPIVHELCAELAAIVEANGFSVGSIGPAWLQPCEQLLRIGPPNAKKACTPEQIRKAMQWANEDSFWWKNVRSMAQLREQYERLRAEAQDPNRAKRGAAGAVQRHGRIIGAPAAVSVPNMNDLYDDDSVPGGRT